MSSDDPCGSSCSSIGDLVTSPTGSYPNSAELSSPAFSDGFSLDLIDGQDVAPVPTAGDEISRLFSLVVTVGVCGALSLFGVVANVINVVVFLKQGFQETINISLFAISVSDFFSALTLLWLSICHNPLFINADIPFLSLDIEVLTSGIPHAIAMNATGWLTALVTFERCVCVAYPLKVKDIISRERAACLVVAIFVLVIAGQIPSYYVLRLEWRFVPERNRTMLGIYAIQGSELIDKVTFYVVNVAAPILSFVTVATLSAILVLQLRTKGRWRKSALTGGAAEKEAEMTSRDWKVIKMVVIVACIFIVSFTPYTLISIVMASEPKFRFYGAYRNAFAISVSVGALLESVNALSNTFVYYYMSSRYKAVFRELFCRSTP